MNTRFLMSAALGAYAAAHAQAEMQSPQAARHILNLDDVEISALVEDVSMVTGYTFIVHPDVRKVRVTVMSQTPMSSDDVFQVFLSTLRVHGFAAVPAGRDTYKIIPEQSAVGEAFVTGSGPNAFVTEILKLNHFNAVEAAQMIKPLIDAQGQVVANANSNTLVVVDYASNLSKLRTIVAELDKDRSVVETVALRNVPASEMETILNKVQGERAREGGPRINFSAVASETSNSIVIRGDELMVERAKQVAAELDQTDPVRDNIRVISLNNSDAVEIVPILERVGVTMAARQSPGEGGTFEPTIAHHEPTNSLVISANYETLLAMERVIEALDVRRAQVLVEAIIVEMSDDTARELGVQFLVSGTEGDAPFASTNFSRSAPNLLALTGALAGDGLFGGDDSVNKTFRDAAVSSLLGANGVTLGFGGQDGDTLFGAIINAVEDDTESRILSTPFGMTLDNATSALVVGQEIPITTGEVLGDANTNPFRTVDRKEIGVKLNVTPRIGEEDTVRLDIEQEVSSIFGSVNAATPDLITNLRSIQTSVIADDGEIIVLGGLVEQTETDVTSQVPILGDIPGIGRLFRSEGKGQTRTNLMVFIKPTIVRDDLDARATTAQKYTYIRAEEIMRGGSDDSSLDRFIEDVVGSTVPRR